MTATFALASPGTGPAVFAAAVCGFVMLVMTAVALSPNPSTFMDAPTARKFSLSVGALLTAFICAMTLPPYFTHVSIDDKRIIVSAWWERDAVARAQLRIDGAREADSALCLAARTGGTAEPGYRDGFFRLKNGARALVYLSDLSHVVAIPVRANASADEWLLLSVDQPESLLVALRRPTAQRNP